VLRKGAHRSISAAEYPPTNIRRSNNLELHLVIIQSSVKERPLNSTQQPEHASFSGDHPDETRLLCARPKPTKNRKFPRAINTLRVTGGRVR
jgi:hypothetical protein